MTQDALEQLLASATLLIQPSLEEGFGLPVAEAMAAGIPVAVSTGGALPEIVRGAPVELFDPLEVDAITDAIDRVAASPVAPPGSLAPSLATTRRRFWPRSNEPGPCNLPFDMGVLSRWRRQPNPALSRAERLTADGRGLEAMKVLGEANRAHPDAALEAELVHARHRAFAELDRAAGPHTLPLADDPFPDVHDEPPEVTPAQLDADTLRGAVQHHGSLLVRGLIPQAEVARLRDDIDCAFAANDAHSHAPTTNAGPWFAPLSGDGIDDRILDFDRAIAIAQGGLLAADSPRALFDVLDLYRRIGILSMLTEYFGEHPTLSARKTTLRKVHADKFFEALDGRGADAGWHQDGAFLGADVRTMNLWVALSECGRNAPSLDLVARRVDRILPTEPQARPSIGRPRRQWSKTSVPVQSCVRTSRPATRCSSTGSWYTKPAPSRR